jgi:hypothetical protein
MPEHWRSNLRCVAPAPVAVVAVPSQLHSGASIRAVPCDPFLQDRGELLRFLRRIDWPVLRVHVWRDMFEHPDLVPRSLRSDSLRRDRESPERFVPSLAALPDYDRMLRCLPYDG